MIRLSIGIEDIDDILWDLEQALDKSQQDSPVTEMFAMAGHAESRAERPQPAQQGVRRAVPEIGQEKIGVRQWR